MEEAAQSPPLERPVAPLLNPSTLELELVVRCLRAHLAGEARVGGHLGEGASWAEVLRLAGAHRVAPLLLESLSGMEGVPSEVLAALRGGVRASVARNLQLTGELVHLLERFKSSGVEVLPFKGPVLAESVYGGLGRRPFGDLDLLVRPRDVWRSVELLAQAGYACEFAWSAWRHRVYHLASGHHYGFYHPEQPLRVELHWRISPGKLAWPIETEGFWARAEACAVAGKPVRCNAPEDLLLLLCIHGARHWWVQLNLLCDVALLLRSRPDLDWNAVRERAREAGCVRALRLGLCMTHRVLGVPLPGPVGEESLRDPVVWSLSEDAWRMLVRETDLEAEHRARWRFYLRLRERFRDQARYVVGQGLNSLFWRSHSTEAPPVGPGAGSAPEPAPTASGRELFLSVVIPTCNRRDRLRKTLAGLAAQRADGPAFEVLVVSDGSTDGTDAAVEAYAREAPYSLRLIRQEQSGPAAARNRGIQAATGDVVVLLDDDVEPGPRFLAAHAAHHQGGDPVAVIGPMLRDPALKGREPLWIDWEHTQLERQYHKWRTGEWRAAGPANFYSGNASLPRSLLLAVGGFDERFHRQEDVELAFRLLREPGVRFRYEPQAVGVHRPSRTCQAWLDVPYAYGRSDVVRARREALDWDALRRTYQRRHHLTRRVAGWMLQSPAFTAAARGTLLAAAQLCARVGCRNAALNALSVVYNTRYLEGVRAELGSTAAVRRLLRPEGQPGV